MNRMIATTLALLSSTLFAQPAPQSPFPKIAEYLQLSATQRSSILLNMDELERSWRNRTAQVVRLTHDAAAETAKPTLDELALGRVYAAIEEHCRGARDDEKRTRNLNLSVLTDPQRNQLQALTEARKLGPTIASAKSLLLASGDSFNPTEYPVGTQASYRPGCFLPSTLRAPDLERGDAAGYLDLQADQAQRLRLILEGLDVAAYELVTGLQSTFNRITEATEQPAVDPATLGRHYAAVEQVCRDWRRQSSEARESAIAVLDAAQKERLRPLQEAARLGGAIHEAVSTGLLPGFFDFSRGQTIFRIGGNPMDETCADLPLTTLFPVYDASRQRTTNPTSRNRPSSPQQ